MVLAPPSTLKSRKHSKISETHFYRLYSIMTGSKIITRSPPGECHLHLKLLSVFYCQLFVRLARVCHICAFLVKNSLFKAMAEMAENGCELLPVVGIRT